MHVAECFESLLSAVVEFGRGSRASCQSAPAVKGPSSVVAITCLASAPWIQ